MTVPKDDFEFDEMLTAALTARPEHPVVTDLAHRAMDLARAQSVSILSRVPASLSPQAIQELARLRRRNRLVAVAASLLIGLMIALGASRVVNGGYLNDALGLSTTDLSTTSATTSTSTSLSLGVVLTGEVLLLALFLLTFAGISHRSNIGPASELAMW
jgi:hypothetical protein